MNAPVKRSGANPQMIVGILAALYGLSPIDAIPDFIPIAGQMDDAFVIIMALLLILVMSLSGGSNE